MILPKTKGKPLLIIGSKGAVLVHTNFNLAYISGDTLDNAFIFHMCNSLWQDLSMGIQIFDLVTLNFEPTLTIAS